MLFVNTKDKYILKQLKLNVIKIRFQMNEIERNNDSLFVDVIYEKN